MPTLRAVTDGAADEHRALLTAFHRDVAQGCFEKEELEPLEEWLAMLDGGDPAQPAFQGKVLVAADDNDGGGAVVGGVLYERYPCGASLLTYLAVHAAHRRRGYGRLLCNACCAELEAQAGTAAASPLFLEAHRSTTADAIMDPTARLKMYSALGFRALAAFPYTAPPVERGSGDVAGLVLLAKVPQGAPPARVDAAAVAAFLPQYWGACEWVEDASALAAMLRWLQEHPVVELVPPECC